MTTVGKTLVGLLAMSLFIAGPAFASSDADVEKELAEMRELVEGLTQKLDAQEEQLQHQGEMLEDAQRVVRDQQDQDGTLSGVAEFWNSVDVGLSVATSYAWNFNEPDVDGGTPANGTGAGFPGAGGNSGASGLFYPFHGDHNSFQVDQVRFEIGKAPTDESRAGFQFSLLFGNTAAFLGQGGNFAPRRATGDSTSDYYVNQAYVSYLADIGEGVQIDAGKFGTLIGAEVADATANYQITISNQFNLFQPIDHTGVLASTSFGPVSVAAAVVNSGALTNGSPDINKEKSYLASIGYGTDQFSIGTTVLYARDGGAFGVSDFGGNGDAYGILDFIASYTGDGFEGWINSNYTWVEGSEASAWGVAIAGLVPITDVFSVSARAEYARDKDNFFGILGNRNSHIYSLAGTLAYELAENLTLKGEVRWDRVNENTPSAGSSGSGEFIGNSGNRPIPPGGPIGTKDDQVVALAQLVYAF